MISGIWDSDASSLIVDSDPRRDELSVQVHSIGKDGAFLTFGVPPVFALGAIMFPRVGSEIHIRGWLARKAVYVDGAGSTGTYQEGFTKTHSDMGL